MKTLHATNASKEAQFNVGRLQSKRSLASEKRNFQVKGCLNKSSIVKGIFRTKKFLISNQLVRIHWVTFRYALTTSIHCLPTSMQYVWMVRLTCSFHLVTFRYSLSAFKALLSISSSDYKSTFFYINIHLWFIKNKENLFKHR